MSICSSYGPKSTHTKKKQNKKVNGQIEMNNKEGNRRWYLTSRWQLNQARLWKLWEEFTSYSCNGEKLLERLQQERAMIFTFLEVQFCPPPENALRFCYCGFGLVSSTSLIYPLALFFLYMSLSPFKTNLKPIFLHWCFLACARPPLFFLTSIMLNNLKLLCLNLFKKYKPGFKSA